MTIDPRAVPVRISAPGGSVYQSPAHIGLREAVPMRLVPDAYAHSVNGARVLNVTSGLVQEIWAGPTDQPVRPDFGSPGQLLAVSASADDAIAGTGARVLIVTYLDGLGFERFGIAQLSGTTPAPLLQARRVENRTEDPFQRLGVEPIQPLTPVEDAYRVVDAYCVSAGSTGINQGRIDVTIDGEIQTVIPIGEVSDSCAQITIPRGQVGILMGLSLSGSRRANANPPEALLVPAFRYPTPAGLSPWIASSRIEGNFGYTVDDLPVARRLIPLSELRWQALQPDGPENVQIGCMIDLLFFPDPESPDPAFADDPLLFPPRLG